MSDEEEAEQFEEMFQKLREYKKVHGNMAVNRTEENRELSNWLVVQRNEYKKLQKNKPSKLTAARLIRFNDIGFEFAKRGHYRSWEQRVEQLREHKAKYGNINIPVTDPELGEFVGRQRVNYNKLQGHAQGKEE
jgi:hypothetical protein